MGQNMSSIAENFIPDTAETIQYEVVKHAKTLSDLNDLTYNEFQKCLMELNELSNKCFQHTGTQLVFAVKKSTDESLLWKATVRVACVKVDTATKKVESYKFLNLKQFIQVFKTFQSHLEVMDASETQSKSKMFSASQVMEEMETMSLNSSVKSSQSSSNDQYNECCICLERKPEMLLPCTHTYCYPCIEQWNMNSKTCPICQEKLNSTDDTWVLSELPDMQEINEEIYTELVKLSKD